MNPKTFVLTLCMTCLLGICYSQDEIEWSKSDPLEAADFRMPVSGTLNELCFAQFHFSYSLEGFSIFNKNFNKNVRNVMLPEASWLVKDHGDTKRVMQFQQILFDIAEVYAREFRRELLVYKKSQFKGMAYVQEINNRIMKDMTEERARFIQESNSGNNYSIMDQWDAQISARLNALELFNYNNDQKIKL